MADTIVVAQGLVKHFGATRAVDGVDLEVDQGTVVGMLGPNGAGKTTTINCLTTLLVPDEGCALVAGYDVVEEPESVRAVISLTGQFAAVDDMLTGRENLELFGRLLRLSRAQARSRAVELLDMFDLADAADRRLKTYSGGMRRRLDLAASMVVEPLVLFLDEPTTGLDPRSRLALWDIVDGLTASGVTVFLTTQYLEEADRLADTIVVIDHGRVIATGTPDELKKQVGGNYCEVELLDPARTGDALGALAGLGADVAQTDGGLLTLPAPDARAPVAEVVRRLEAVDVRIAHVGLRRPTLDEVFLALTDD